MPKRKYQTPEIMHDAPLTGAKAADFHFDDFAATLARLITSPKTETPLAIGINGAWGSGKTSLLLRVKNMLDEPKDKDGSHRFAEGEEKDFRKCKTVWFDAWKYNDEDELLVALVRVILQAMGRDGFINKVKAWLDDPKQKSYDVFGMFINAFQVSFGGLGAEFKFQLDPKKHEQISPFEKYTAFFDHFDEAFDLLLKTWCGNGTLVVFIDDLDRCLPAKTVQTLEAIKLFLDKSGCVFLLGADTKIVQAAVETHYKNAGITGESAKDYLEKIIQIRFDIPPIVEEAMENYLKAENEANKSKVDEAMLKRWQALVAAAEVNPRRVKNVINDLNLQWFMAVNSGQADPKLRDDFICWQALMRAAPESFVKQITDLSEFPEIRHDFVLKAVKWQQGTEAEKKEVEGQYSAYKDFKRLRGVLKQISFSDEFTPDALDSMIYMSAPPPKPPEPIKSLLEEQIEKPTYQEEALLGTVGEVKEPVAMRGEKRGISGDQNQIEIGGIRFMRVIAGKFVMGSKERGEFDHASERPQHTIDLSYDYWMAKFILTNRQFSEFIKDAKHVTTAEKEGGWHQKQVKYIKGVDWKHSTDQKDKWEDKEDHPVVQVSWDDAMAYCKWFNETFKSELGDLLLRLPTEAEWEKAARGAYGKEWPWGNEFDPSKCNSVEGRKGSTTPVGAYSSTGGDSPYGCADMVGDVWEWTHSLYTKYPYSAKDGREDETSRDSRVLRGGSFGNDRDLARCASRFNDAPDGRDEFIGFRVCVSSPSYI